MERFVAQCNITRFELMLRETADPAEKRLIEELLTEEQRKLRRTVGPAIADLTPVTQPSQPCGPVPSR